MESIYKKGLLFLIISFTGSLLILWLVKERRIEHAGQKKMMFVCTTNIIGDAVSFIAGEYADVYCLMGPGIDPHTYRACEGDVHRLLKAEMVFVNGLHLEGRMHDIFETLARTVPVCTVTDCLERAVLYEPYEGVYDPHVWHDLFLWQQAVSYIAQTIAAYDPEHAAYFYMRAQRYTQELADLDAYSTQRLAHLAPSQRILVTAHDAFYYFAQRYNFRVVGLQGISTDAEVTLADIAEAIALIVQHKVPTIFLESSVSARSIHAVQEGVNRCGWAVALGKELYSDSLGCQDSGASTYCTMMRHNIDAIVDGLEKKN
jgi:manganese/zinc/iron transport system substrate-binding protein